MKRTCKGIRSDGKNKRRAMRRAAVVKALETYLGTERIHAWRFAYGLCRDREEAGELLQEACYRALKAGKVYDRTKPIKSWLYTIMRRVYLDSRRRVERRRGRSLDSQAGAILLETLSDSTDSPSQAMEQGRTKQAVRQALRRLPAIHREVVILCGLDRMSYAAAAQVLAVPVGTVRSRLFRARRKLRRDAALRGLA